MGLTKKFRALSTQSGLEPQLILAIDGIPLIFGAIGVEKLLRFDDGFRFDEELRFDTPVLEPSSRDVISIEGTTSRISQQVNIDKGGANSIQRMNFLLIDQYGEISEALSNGLHVEELLGRKAEIYVMLRGGVFPEDALRVAKGLIDEISVAAGSVTVGVSQADKYKDQVIWSPYTTELDQNIDAVQTSFAVVDASGVMLSQDALTSYIRVEDEIMQVISVSGNTLTVVRGRLGSQAVTHDIDTEVATCFVLEGTAIDLALKLCMSQSQGESFSAQALFVRLTNDVSFPDAIGFAFDVRRIGLTRGDTLQVISPSNTGTYIIQDIGEVDNITYLRVGNNLTQGLEDADFLVRSRYDVLPIGAGMTVDDIDVVGHETISNFFGSNLIEYKFFIEDELDLKKFVESELFFPQGLYGIVREGRSSVKFTAPALVSSQTLRLSSDNVVSPERIRPVRSISQYFYNAIFYKYGKSFVTGKFLSTDIRVSAVSLARFKAGTKQLTIEASGIERNATNTAIIALQSRRYLDRYEFAPRYIQGVQVLFGEGLALEIGDTVILDGEDLMLVDQTSSARYMRPTIFEIVSRTVNYFNGVIQLDLLETNFLLDSRFGVFSQSSRVVSSSSGSATVIESFLGAFEFASEIDKWRDFVGQKLHIYSDDYTYSEVTTLIGFSQTLENTLLFSDAITPPIGAMIELADYSLADLGKIRFTFLSASRAWTQNTSNSVVVQNADGFYVGQKVELTTNQYDFFLTATISAIVYQPIPNDYVIELGSIDLTPILTHTNYIINALTFEDDENVYRYY